MYLQCMRVATMTGDERRWQVSRRVSERASEKWVEEEEKKKGQDAMMCEGAPKSRTTRDRGKHRVKAG